MITNLFTPAKRVKLDLTTVDSNAFYLMGAFKREAMRQKWARPEIDKVIQEATTGDYNHLVGVLVEHCEE